MNNFIDIPEPPYGKERRKMIIEKFNRIENAALAVNCKYRPQLKIDPDLQYLIKRKFLKSVRISRGSCRTKLTILVKV